MINKRSEKKRGIFRLYCRFNPSNLSHGSSIFAAVVYKRYFTGRYISAGALRGRRCFTYVSVSPMISIRIPVIYVQYPSFERDHPYYVYISQCAAGRHEIALVIFLRRSAFTVLAGHRKERRNGGVEQGYNKATAAATVALPFSRLPPFLAFFPVCLCSALFDPER